MLCMLCSWYLTQGESQSGKQHLPEQFTQCSNARRCLPRFNVSSSRCQTAAESRKCYTRHLLVFRVVTRIRKWSARHLVSLIWPLSLRFSCSWLCVFCISLHSFSINSTLGVCSSRNSHEGSCLCRCWDRHMCSESHRESCPFKSSCNRISSLYLHGCYESHLHYSLSGEARLYRNGGHTNVNLLWSLSFMQRIMLMVLLC